MYLCWWTVCPRGYLSFGTTSFMSSTTHNTTILADASPSIIRRHSSESIRDTDSRSSLGVPRIVLRDIKDMSYVQSTDSQFWYKNNSSFNVLKQSHVSLTIYLQILILCVLFLNVLPKTVKPVTF